MLEIVAIVYLGNKIHNLMKSKGIKSLKYVLLMIFMWLGFEFIGVIIGTILVGGGLAAYPFGIAGAVLAKSASNAARKIATSLVAFNKLL